MNQQNHTDITGYLRTLNRRFSAGNASEHTYRKDLEDLLTALLPEIEVTNEPSKVTDCGNPDYLLTQKSIPVGFIEAKDIGKDLSYKQYQEQFADSVGLFPSFGGVPRSGGVVTDPQVTSLSNLGTATTPLLRDTPPREGNDISSKGGELPHFKRNTQNYKKLPYNPKLKERAKALRKAGNLSEVLFWQQVKHKQFKGLDFDRQKIIGNYIVDFYCTNCHVVIEIDGSSHDDKYEYDQQREAFLQSLGLTVIHILDTDVKNNLENVMLWLNQHQAFNSPPLEGCLKGGVVTDPQATSLSNLGTATTPSLRDTPPKEGNKSFTPENLLDYIYAVLHSPGYREKYKAFLKIDFPRVPFPESAERFWQLVTLGEQLRLWHLLKHPQLEDFSRFITAYPIAGDNEITRKMTKNSIGYDTIDETHGKVWINDTQYFDKVPKSAWEFYIGGYQPAQKWLKDRVGRTLSYNDIVHYQRMILAMNKTEEIMQMIDKV